MSWSTFTHKLYQCFIVGAILLFFVFGLFISAEGYCQTFPHACSGTGHVPEEPRP